MLDRTDAILKLALAIIALSLASTVGYRYRLLLPQQVHQVRDEQAAGATPEFIGQRQSPAKSEEIVAGAKADYMTCIAAVQTDYYSRWDRSCATLHESEKKAQADCFAQGYEDEYCDVYFQVRPAVGCRLPSSTAESYDKRRDITKRRCLEEFRAKIS